MKQVLELDWNEEGILVSCKDVSPKTWTQEDSYRHFLSSIRPDDKTLLAEDDDETGDGQT